MSPTDYIAGATSPIVYEERNPSGNWIDSLPTFEKQWFTGFDTMACVSFSFNNSIEIQHKFLTGEEINLSDRALAKMSDTTTAGNYLHKVAETARLKGLILESLWSSVGNFQTWGEYYAPIPPEVMATARLYPIAYEWITNITRENLMYHLKHAPLQIVHPGHAIVELLQTSDVHKYFDTYLPAVKEKVELPIAVLKIILTKQNMYRLVRANKDVYRIKDGKKDMFLNGVSFIALDGRWNQIEPITQVELDAIPDGNVLIAVPQE